MCDIDTRALWLVEESSWFGFRDVSLLTLYRLVKNSMDRRLCAGQHKHRGDHTIVEIRDLRICQSLIAAKNGCIL